MTLKQKALWFIGLPCVSAAFWMLVAVVTLSITPDRSGNPACSTPPSQWNDSVSIACAGDEYGLALAGVLMMGEISLLLLLVGIVVFAVFAVSTVVVKKPKRV